MRSSEKRPRRRSKNKVSIRWRLTVSIAIFVAFTLVMVWVFQIFLLDVFFRGIKKSEMRHAAQSLIEVLETDQLKNQTFSEAVDHSLCVMIYRIGQEDAEQIANVDATGSNVIMTLSNEQIGGLYEKARENGGSYFSRIAFGGQEVNEDGDVGALFDRYEIKDPSGRPVRIPSKNVRMVYLKLATTASGSEYLILLDASMHPLGSTVDTLSTQFFWICSILVIMAGITVFVLYRRITDPLIRMNESAKMLAQGRYDVDFVGDGYLETYELAQTLNYASHELSRVDTLQKELIANISHDLRTPLTMIKGYSEIMRDLPGENTPENMQVVIDETTRLSELVNDLLDLSKLRSGGTTPTLETLDLTALIREVMQRYDTLTKHRGYRVTFDASCSAWVSADRSMLLQVVYNLINNAINYTGEDKTVSVKQTVDGQTVRISVTDTGEGIAPEEIPHIWDRYYKVDKVHRRAMIGTGLGLSIVKEILEQHGAAYGVESVVGQGSTFWFTLPLTETDDKIPQENPQKL